MTIKDIIRELTKSSFKIYILYGIYIQLNTTANIAIFIIAYFNNVDAIKNIALYAIPIIENTIIATNDTIATPSLY